MANNLYPVLYKPGIKRDGSPFQAEYCTTGQWARFQRGYIKKIGGMKGFTVKDDSNRVYNATDLIVIPSGDNISIYVAGHASNGGTGTGAPSINQYTITQDFVLVNSSSIASFTMGQVVFQHEFVIQGETQLIIYLASPNNTNINNNDECKLFSTKTNSFNITPIPNPPSLIGLSGLLFASNYLFVYGSNGLVQWSKRNNPLDFSNPTSREIRISTDKVIYASSIRGGLNNPAILFWTMSSVVRCINNPTPNTPPDTLAFSIDIISKTSSILSSRCVVEYDGVFYWPGINRFFIYNGLVDKLPNTMNKNFFFNNIDMRYRQNVFGVRNQQYNEIWWFYPEKMGTLGRLNVPEGQNSRAIIYNVEEKTWYDTAISRSCGTYSDALGIMATYGRSLTDPTNTIPYLFRHEYETFNPANTRSIYEIFPIFNPDLLRHTGIVTSITTPTISWAAFNALKQFTGADRWVNLITMEPDFILMPSSQVAPGLGGNDMTVILNSKEYPQSVSILSSPYPIPSPLTSIQDDPTKAKIDLALTGRYITLTFSATCNFEMGQIMLKLGIGDGQ